MENDQETKEIIDKKSNILTNLYYYGCIFEK